MPKYAPLFSKIKITRECEACGGTRKLQRHHLAREKLFIAIHRKSSLYKTKWYAQLVERYKGFHDFDIRLLCEPCHKKIHRRLNKVLREWNNLRGWPPKNIAFYSTVECNELMKVFREASLEWIIKEQKKRKKNAN